MASSDDLALLGRAVDQQAGLLDRVRDDSLGNRTPCDAWTVQDLVDHIVAAPTKFAAMVRGQSIDWSAPTPAAGTEPVAALRAHGEDHFRAWRHTDDPAAAASIDWQCAEFAVHTWALAAAALGRTTTDLDADVAERGLAFMRANLTTDKRGPAFGPEQPAPEGADPYQRIAAFAGRRVW